MDDSDMPLEESENWLGDSSMIVEPVKVGVVVVVVVAMVVVEVVLWLRFLM